MQHLLRQVLAHIEAMALSHLKKSEFWRRKLHTAVALQDVDKDGFITRHDFDLIVQHYKDAGSPPEHIKEMEKSFKVMYKIWGVPEDRKMTLEEFEKNYADGIVETHANADEFFLNMFKQIDINGDGMISVREWQVHNAAIRIDSESAKKSFEAMDTNHDGVISKEEFVAFHKEFFFTTEDKLKSSLLFGPLM